MRHGRLTSDKRKAIALFAEGKSPGAVIAALNGPSRRTIERWQKEPAFIEALAIAIAGGKATTKLPEATTGEITPARLALLSESAFECLSRRLTADGRLAFEFLNNVRAFDAARAKAKAGPTGFRVLFGEMPNDPEPSQKKIVELRPVDKPTAAQGG